MRIAYLLHWNEGPESGVFKKVLNQTTFWKSHGCEVKIFLITRREEYDTFKNPEISMENVSYGKRFADRFNKMKQLVIEIMNWNPDLVYTRYDLYYPAKSKLADAVPMVLEVNTDDTTEFMGRPFHVYCYNSVTRGMVLAAASGTVFISDELSKKPNFISHTKKAVVISNGINLSKYPLMPPTCNQNPRLVFMGSPNQPWHGIDKIVYMACQLPEWTFDLIGIGPSHFRGVLPPNIVLHGFMDRNSYEKVIAQADAAIGTLALYRNQMEEASPLKVREYLAYGIPTIIGYKDTDFPESNRYILRIPNQSDNVKNSLQEITDFVKGLQGTRVPREFIKHIDVKYKEKDRLEFMCSIAKEG